MIRMLLDRGCGHPPVGESVDRLRIKAELSGREGNLINETALDIGAEGRTGDTEDGHRLLGADQGSMVLWLFAGPQDLLGLVFRHGVVPGQDRPD